MKVNCGVGGMIKIGLILISIFLFAGIAFSADSSGWKQVIEAANKEGRVVISGPPGEEWRKSIVDMFQQEYSKITVEFSAMAGRNFGDRIRKERELGKKLWDLRLSIRATTGSGSISLLEGGPHPNAARVYINWLLSPTTQAKLSKNTELNSRRTDVPAADKDSAVDPTKMSKYRNAATEENSDHDGKLLPLIRAALKR